MIRRTSLFLLLGSVFLSGSAAHAQQVLDPPAHVAFVDGAAVLERDGTRDASPASMPLLAGDRLRTDGGRLEVLFSDGSTLHLDTGTVVDFQSDEVVRLLQGRVRLSVAGPRRDLFYRVDAPSAWVQIAEPGEYRVSVLRDGEVELAVLRGAAELVNEAGRSYIQAGERTYAAAGSAPSPPYVFNSAAWDSFDSWSEARRADRLSASAQYLPSEVRPYAAAFDAYGTWRYHQPYGYVWYPRVSIGWRPYYKGRWASLRPYGWTWIAADPWGWPTHHYGRWGFSAGVWFWVPGRHWAPAWVSWGYAPGFVGWCALGPDNRPVVQFVNVNIYGGRGYDPWHAWTAVPRRHFGGAYVNVVNVATLRPAASVQRQFVVQERAPDLAVSVGRTAVPIRTAGRYAVPRGSAVAEGTGASREGAGRRLPAPAREAGTPVRGGATLTRSGEPRTRAVRRDDTSQGPSSRVAGRDLPAARGDTSAARRRQHETALEPDGGRAETPAVTVPPPGAVRAIRRSTPEAADSGASPVRGARGRGVLRSPQAPVPSPAPQRSATEATAAPRGYGARGGAAVPRRSEESAGQPPARSYGVYGRPSPSADAPRAPAPRSRGAYEAPGARRAPADRQAPGPSRALPRQEATPAPPAPRAEPQGRGAPPEAGAPSRRAPRAGGDAGDAPRARGRRRE